MSNSCGTDSIKIAITVTPASACANGIAVETLPADDLQVSPNPSHDLFVLNLTSPLDVQAQDVVTNATGQKVEELTCSTNTPTDLRIYQPPGIYFITASTPTNRYRVK